MLIRPQAETSGTIALIPNPTASFSIQHANGEVQQITTRGLVIKAAKDWLAPTLTMIAVEA
jgi:hypothetical protein